MLPDMADDLIGKYVSSWKVWQLPPTAGLILPLLRQLGIARTVDRHCPIRPQAELTHGQVVEAMLLHILQDNRRLPLYKFDHWARRYHLELLYDCDPGAFNDDRLARALDALAPAVAGVQAQVVTDILRRYKLPVRAVHWDLTHVSFTGAYEDSALIEAGYGHSTLHQKQIKLSLHVDSDSGLPLSYKALPGATNQTPLAPGFLGQLQRQLGRSDLIVIADRAGLSYDNIVCYERSGARFIAPLQATPAEAAAIAAPPLEAFEPLSYRSQSKPHETFSYHAMTLSLTRQKQSQTLPVQALIIHSSQKQRDDQERRDKALARTLEELEKVRGYLNKAQYARRAYAEEKLAKKIPPALKDVVRWQLSGPDKQLSLQYEVAPQALAEAARSDGRYLLLHNLGDSSPDEIFALFKRQYVIESRFRNFKSDLRVNPFWLHKDHRIEALLLVFVLALMLYSLLDLLSERAGLESQWYHKLTARAMLEVFDYTTLQELRLIDHPPRYKLELSEQQREIIEALGLPEPERLLNLPKS
jgi:transposase